MKIPVLPLTGSLFIMLGIIIVVATPGNVGAAWTALTLQVSGVVMLVIFMGMNLAKRRKMK